MSQDKSDKVLAVSPAFKADEADSAERTIADLRIERFEMPVNLARRAGYGLGILVLIIFLWAAFAPVDIIARGPGQLEPYGKPNHIESEVEGQIDEIEVKEGDHVTKGQKLLLLNSVILRSRLDEARMKLRQAKIKYDQLDQGKKGLEKIIATPSVLPANALDAGDTARIIDQVYTSFKTFEDSKYDATGGGTGENASAVTDLREMRTRLTDERAEKLRQKALLKQEVADNEIKKAAEIRGFIEQIASHREMLNELQNVRSISQEQERDYAKVLDLGVSRVQYLNVKEKVAESTRKVKDEESAIARLENQLKVARLDLPAWRAESKSRMAGLEAEIEQLGSSIDGVNLKIRRERREENKEEAAYNAALERAKATLARIKGDLEAQSKEVADVEDEVKIATKSLDESIIKAPVSGTATGLRIHGIGEVVKPGEILLQIIPDKSDMVISARIPNRDIGFVKVGQDTKIKLDAFPFQDFGVLHGKVRDIERYPEIDGKRGFTYKVWVEPKQLYVEARGQKVPLKDGLTCECEIVVRRVSVLWALLRPIAKLTDVNMKE